MNHIVKRIGILTGVFAAALCVFFLANNRWNSGQDQAVYMDMEAASLPSITVQMLGRDMNRLYGYRQEMNTTAAGENLTILPEDRALTVDITGGGVTGCSWAGIAACGSAATDTSGEVRNAVSSVPASSSL